MNPLLAFKLPKYDKISEKIIDSNNNFLLSPCMIHPLFKLGYHHFIDRTRSALSITDKIDSKNEFYYVVNNFESVIPDYKDNIQNLTKIYMNYSVDEIGENFYKFWEIFFIFNVVDDVKNISIFANDPTDYEECITKFYEKILSKDIKKIKFTNANIIPENEFEYEKTKTNQFLGKEKVKNIKLVNNLINETIKTKEYSQLIIANAENIYNNKNNKEQESYKLILGEILGILNIQDKKGNSIIKFFDTFTLITLKIIYILCCLYDDIYIYKPYLSRLSEPEKFLICKNFKFSNTDKNVKVLISKIEEIIKALDSNEFLNDIFLDFEIPTNLINDFKFINVTLVNKQQILINEIIKYIKENNYFGDKYHIFKNNQIDSTKWWINIFYPPSNNIYKSNKELINKLLISTNEKNTSEKDKFIANFI